MTTMSEARPKTPEEKLLEVERTEPTVDVKLMYGQTMISVELPHGCRGYGIIYAKKHGQIELRLASIKVPEELQGKEIGTRITREILKAARSFNVALLSANTISSGGLRTFVRITGKDNLSFHKPYPHPEDDPEGAERARMEAEFPRPIMQMTFEEAIIFLDAQNPEADRMGVDVSAPLPEEFKAKEYIN